MHWLLIPFVLLAPLVILQILIRVRVGGSLYPYQMVLSSKVLAIQGFCLHRTRLFRNLPPPEFFQAIGQQSVENYKRIAKASSELDVLPTIRKGNEALGLRCTLDAQVRPVHSKSSPYTHKLQRPYFFIPGVPSKTFYDPNEFDWVRPLEESFLDVKQELQSLLESERREFKEYRSEYANILPGWNTFNLFIYGKRVEENCQRCPKTVALLESLPRFEKQHIMFSALNPHSHLPAHYGPMNGILRGHLPLIVPEGCRIRVGDDVRTWEEGKVLVFDDSYNHEVWNDSDRIRIVLFMNFWHPCFSEQELEVLERLRRTLEEGPVAQDWKKYQFEPRADTLILKQESHEK